MDRIVHRLLGIVFLLATVQVQAQTTEWEELRNRFTYLFHQEHYALASQVATDAVTLARTSFGQDDPRLAVALEALATAVSQKGRYTQAATLLREAIAIREHRYGMADTARLRYLRRLGDTYYNTGAFDLARPIFAEVIDRSIEAHGRNNAETAQALRSLAEVAYEQEKYDESATLLRQAVLSFEGACGSNDKSVRETSLRLAAVYVAARKVDQARATYREVIATTEPVAGQMSDALVPALTGLARLEAGAGNPDAAEAAYYRIIAIDRVNHGDVAPVLAVDMGNLVDLYTRNGKHAQALPLAERIATIWEQTPGAPRINIARSYDALAAIYDAAGRGQDAERAYARAIEVAGDAREIAYTIQYLTNLAAHHQRHNDLAQARRALERALDVAARRGGPEIDVKSLQAKYAAIVTAIEQGTAPSDMQ